MAASASSPARGIPIISSDLLPAVRRGAVAVRPAVERLAGDRVRFTDASEEQFDEIIYATGYQLGLPFLAPGLVSVNGREVVLYRRIVPLWHLSAPFFAGCVDAPGGLLPLVETQGEWIAAVLTGHLVLPPTGQMWRAIARAERRTRQRFPDESPLSIRCDPHAYRRLLRADLRRTAPRTLRPRLRRGSRHPLSRCRFRLISPPAAHESGRG